MAKVIAIANQKGGVGKTTTAIELSVCLTDLGKKVLLIDVDQQCDASYNSKCSISNTIDDVFQQKCKIPEAIQHTEYYDIIPSSPNLSNADKIYIERDDIFLLTDVCEILNNYYDYIIIDNPPARNTILNMSYVAADFVICPALADEDSLRGIVAVERDIEKLRDSRNQDSHARIIGLVLPRFKKTTAHTHALESLNNFAQSLKGEVFVNTIRDSIVVTEIKTVKEPLQRYSKYNNVAVDYRAIAKEVIRIEE